MIPRLFFVAIFVALQFCMPWYVSAEAGADLVAQRRAQLEQSLAQLEAEIADQQKILQGKQTERQSLERDVAILDAQIEKAKLSIKARDISIQKLTDDISDKADTISELDEKMIRERQSLANILRKTKEVDEQTFMEFLLSSGSVSNFFKDVDSFASINIALRDSFAKITSTKTDTTVAKATLESKREDEEQLKKLQVFEQQKILDQEKEKQVILRATKGQESAYQAIVKLKQKSAAQVRAELFTLRDSAAIPFGQALEYANVASKKTGVRPALILGILTQETELGENLGTGSYLTDMHPTRDVPVFLKITEELGYNPAVMPVSKQPGYGWGGAMGPGQFIPSTWACLGGFVNSTTGRCGKGTDGTYKGPWVYNESKDTIRRFLGKSTPSDPWQNADAFMATAVLMKENGAIQGDPASERLAALRYFAGFGNANKRAYAFYGDSVMEHTLFFQQQIDTLGGS